MLGCHRTREVALVLQNGLRFRFRESQDLSIKTKRSLVGHLISDEVIVV